MRLTLSDELIRAIEAYCGNDRHSAEPYEDDIMERLRQLLQAPDELRFALVSQFSFADWCWYAGTQQRESLVLSALSLGTSADPNAVDRLRTKQKAEGLGRWIMEQLLTLKEQVLSLRLPPESGGDESSDMDARGMALQAIHRGMRVLYPEMSELHVNAALMEFARKGLPRTYTVHRISLEPDDAADTPRKRRGTSKRKRET